jgi:hypothetical protein
VGDCSAQHRLDSTMTGQVAYLDFRRIPRLIENYWGPEVGFGEITIDLLEARFWTAAGSALGEAQRRRASRRSFFLLFDESLFGSRGPSSSASLALNPHDVDSGGLRLV